MSMIRVQHVTFSYPGSYDNIFEDVSFLIDTDWKLGFVGRNGRGKTTFLKLLLGMHEYSYSGQITASVTFDYFPYPVEHPERMTEEVLQAISPEAESWELMRELSYLEVNAEVLYRPFETLSHGERTKVLLAALFLNQGHFLLIDEPTNHLDMKARQIVAQYLNHKKGFILVSHDRCFLDDCVDHILFIHRSDIQIQSGNFSSYMVNFERQMGFEQTQNHRLQREIQNLQEAAEKTSAWSERTEASKYGKDVFDRGFVGHKAAKMMKRSKVMEGRLTQKIQEKSTLLKNVEVEEPLKLFPLTYFTDLCVSFSEVSVSYDGQAVCRPVTCEVHVGERIALDGRNGSGKSSLLKLLLGQDICHTGTVRVGSGLVISYVPQDTSGLHGTLTELARDNHLDESLLKAILRKMDFERVQFEKDMRDFSGGQKKKVLIAKSLCERAHLYVWDELLNFIDIYSRMQIQTLLQTFAPTMLFIEHDRAFREAIATKIVTLS